MLDHIRVDDDIRQVVAQSIDHYGLTQLPTEFGAFLQLVRDLRPTTVVEIGTYTGASIWALGQICPPHTLLITLDIVTHPLLFKGPFKELSWTPTLVWRLPRPVLDVILTQDGRRYHRVIGNSQRPATRRLVEAIMQLHGRCTIDVLFIDGDHSETGVRRDFELYSPLVRTGGLIAFHDIIESDWGRSKGHFVYPLWKDLQAKPGWKATELKDRSDAVYLGNPAWKQMGIGLVEKLEGTPVEMAHVPAAKLIWNGYRAGHLVKMGLQYAIHKIGGITKRLIGRSPSG